MAIIDSVVFGWVTSYLLGSLPTIKDVLSKNKDLDKRIMDCYQSALKKWCPNSIIREKVRERFASIESLREYMLSKPKDEEYGVDRLLHLWSDQLRNDPICYNYILEAKVDRISEGVQEVNNAITQVDLQMNRRLDQLAEMMQSGNKDRLKSFLRSFIDESIVPLIEYLKVKTALSVLESIERLCVDVLQSESALLSELKYLKGKSLRYLNPKQAIDCFHEAFLLSPDEESYIVTEIRNCLNKNDRDGARSLMAKLQPNNMYRQAVEIVLSDDPECQYSLSLDLKNNSVAKQEICELMMLNGQQEIDFLFESDIAKDSPYVLSYSNLKEWLYLISCHRMAISSVLIVHRDSCGDKYRNAYDLVNRFVNLLSDTDLKDAFPVISLLYHYWGYLIDGEKSRIREYQRIDKSAIGDQKQIFRLYEICMLQMSGETEEAFAIICDMSNSVDQSVIDLSLLIGHDYRNDDYIRFALIQARDNKIALNSFESSILACYIDHDNVTIVSEFIDSLVFINHVEKDLLRQLCNFAKKEPVDISGFKDEIDNLTDELTAFAALLMAKAGEDELAVMILSPRVDEQMLDLKARVFIDVLSVNPYHHPHLYRILQDNRKRGSYQIDLLKKEAHLASLLADYTGAFEVLEILHRECPCDEEVSVNYINAWLRSGRPLSSDLMFIIEKLDISSTDRVRFIYAALVETNNVEYAAIFLHDKTVALGDDQLRHLFFGESTTGYIAKIVSTELDKVTPGACVILRYRDRPKALIVKENTPLGEKLIGRTKGDIITVLRDEYEIISIHPHLFKLHADYLDEVVTNGGNERMMPIFIDENNILESIENAIKQFSPESYNYEEQRQKKIDEYKKGNIPYSNLIEIPDVIGGYYKGLFTSFAYKVPFAYLSFDTVSQINDNSRFVLELPSLLLLFEFSNKSGYNPKLKPIVSNVLYEYIKYKKTFLNYHISIPFYEAIRSENIYRYSEDISEDIQLRMQALIAWIEANCQIVSNEEALAMEETRSNDSELSRLFQHTISFLMRKDADYVLISDEAYYSRIIQTLPRISSEIFVKLFNEDSYKAFLNFMFDCHICGASLTEQIIIDEYKKLEVGGKNRFSEIIYNIKSNPISFQAVLSASISLASEKGDTEMLTNALTDLFESSFGILDHEFFKSQEWHSLMTMLSLPIKGYGVVKKCIENAKQKLLS